MKKSTKTIKSPAPAKNPAPTPALALIPAAAAKPAVKKIAVPAAPAVKTVTTTSVATTITTKIDIGFGNALYIRGEGPGLSWNKGARMNCVADDQWQFIVKESARPIVFKVLVNDLSWNAGADYSVAPGASVALNPRF